MLALILKDLYENRVAWILFTSANLCVLVLSEVIDLSEEKQKAVFGFLYAVTVASAMIFAQAVVVLERKRRHFILLKSLPISDLRVIGSKFSAMLILTLSLTNVPFIYSLLRSTSVGLPGWLLLNSAVIAYSALLFSLGLRFNNQAALLLPLYLMIGLMLLFSSDLGAPERFPVILTNSAVLSVFNLVLACSFWRWAVRVFSRKELEV